MVTASELLVGAERASDAYRAKRLAFVEQTLRSLEPIAITLTIARAHARLRAQMATRGSTLSTNDSWIAATALAIGARLATRDGAFAHISGLDLVSI